MGTVFTLEGKEALAAIRDIFRDVRFGSEHRVRMTGTDLNRHEVEFDAKIAIAGFSDERPKENGTLDTVTHQEGSVLYYGPVQPDYCLLMDRGGKSIVFPLENFKMLRTVEAGCHSLVLSSPLWKRFLAIEITLSINAADVDAESVDRPIFTGQQALDHFVNTLGPKVNNGNFVARLGKWASKKAFDKALTREQAEKRVLADAVGRPESDRIRTMSMGTDIGLLEMATSLGATGLQLVLKVRTHLDSTEIRFSGMVIEPDTPGKEAGTRNSLSTYVYLIDTSFNSSSNLVIIRQREKGRE